ncbi:MOSC domain-containing protein YiiM [Draconibacterium orientale]|jgi:MOSC domain-containing protein YiiM|uniref:MOSC domain-containing protein YiiM n=1 Tax=Draconibacterium orientale TaxID=1168034 RepID=X5DEE6_9BACT|nr:MOSC domain-containing protein [Draconibacterium orientale]AHW58737.1 sulfurase [Draconibacterium orientale]SEU09549.1 MOSC domain-containing protein YiiM [Draconibacterium orientale]
MKIISTNIAEARIINWKGKEVPTGLYKFGVDKGIFLGKEDVKHDNVMDRRYHGGVDKACYLYSADHYQYWQDLYPHLEMPWGMFGENLTVKGLHEKETNIGDTYKIGEAVVQVTQPRQPCFKLQFRFNNNNIVRQFIDSGLSGVYVRVLQKGHVNPGDNMQLIERKQSLSIHEVYTLLYAGEFDEKVKKAVNDPLIAESCKRDLIKRWGDYL